MTFLKSKPCTEYGCSSPRFSNGLCKYHCALKAAKTPKKKPINEKKQARMAKYYEMRDDYLKEHPICEVDGCECNKVDLHHKSSRLGENLYKHFMSVCREHHEMIHRLSGWAYENGYLLKRNYKNND